MMTTYELPPLDMIGWGIKYVKSILYSRNHKWTGSCAGSCRWAN
jgi:hypothetical protein